MWLYEDDDENGDDDDNYNGIIPNNCFENSEAVGVEGVVIYPNETLEHYAWGLGTVTNNQAEKWSLWMGLSILK